MAMQGKQAWRRVTWRAEEGDEFLMLLRFPDTQVAFYVGQDQRFAQLRTAGVC